MVATSILFYSLMSSSLFQGSIIKDLNTHKSTGKITKIDELLKHKFAIGMQPVLTYVFREDGGDRISKELKRVSPDFQQIGFTSEAAIERLKSDYNFAYLWVEGNKAFQSI